MNDLQLINTIIKINKNLKGIDYLKVYVKNIANFLDVKYVFIGHSINNKQIQTDIVWDGNDYVDNFKYELQDTPCEIVLGEKRVCIYESNVSKKFNNDKLLEKLHIESYVGAPVQNSLNKDSFGLLVILDDKPIHNKVFYSEVFEFLAHRASIEIEKSMLEETLIKKVKEQTTELRVMNLELEEANKEIELFTFTLKKRVEEEIKKIKIKIKYY